MKVTLDTNVLVSAFISRQENPARILDTIATLDEITLVLSREIIDEFRDVLNRHEVVERFGYSEEDVSDFVQAVRGVSTIVRTKSRFKVVKDDPKDDVILSAAHDGKADYLVSGDSHLRRIGKFRGTKIRQSERILGGRKEGVRRTHAVIDSKSELASTLQKLDPRVSSHICLFVRKPSPLNRNGKNSAKVCHRSRSARTSGRNDQARSRKRCY